MFDLDSIVADRAIAACATGPLLSGRTLSQPPDCSSARPRTRSRPRYEFRPLRLAKKIAAGAHSSRRSTASTSPLLEDFMARVRELGLHERCFILVGVGPLASARAARWIRGTCRACTSRTR